MLLVVTLYMGILSSNKLNNLNQLENTKVTRFCVVPMRFCSPFRPFVLSGKNRYSINHNVVQKVVSQKIREPF